MCIVQTKASVDANQPGTVRARPLGFRQVTALARPYTTLKDKFTEAADNENEDKCIPQTGECMEYIGLISESCKKEDHYDRMEAMCQSNCKYSVN